MLCKRSEIEVFTGSLGKTDRFTLCTELNLARRTPLSGGLASPGRVGAALRSLGNCGGGVGRESHRRPCCSVMIDYHNRATWPFSVVSAMLL